MITVLIKRWTEYREADRRQLPLFPEWERARWLAPLPSVGAALTLAALVAVGTPWTPEDVMERTAKLTTPTAEPDEPAVRTYDLAAIPEHIKAAAKRYNLSEELITAVIEVESNFDHAAVSRKGAQGLMQLMPQTAAMMGVQDPHDPDENIDAGASHLRAMLDTFKGDLPLALAAYNAGQTHVVRHKGIPPFPETRRFVARVLRRFEDKQGTPPAKSVPEPQWIARAPRPQSKDPKDHVATVPAPRWTGARHTPVALAPPRAPERATQLVVQDMESRPTPRVWTATPASIPALVQASTPAPRPVPLNALDRPVAPNPPVRVGQAP